MEREGCRFDDMSSALLRGEGDRKLKARSLSRCSLVVVARIAVDDAESMKDAALAANLVDVLC